MTTGILLRYMAGDALLSAFSHVIVDEVGYSQLTLMYHRSLVTRLQWTVHLPACALRS